MAGPALTVTAGTGRSVRLVPAVKADAPYWRAVYPMSVPSTATRRLSVTTESWAPRLPGRIIVGPPRVSLSSQTRRAWVTVSVDRQKLRYWMLLAACQPSPCSSAP